MPVLLQGDQLLPLGPDNTVGSGAQASQRIQGQDLAARHFVLRIGPDGTATVAPAAESCVVAVNGQQVHRGGAQLGDGDVIEAGQARFVYGAGDAARAAAAPAARDAYLVDTTGRRAYQLARRSVQIGRDAAAGIALKDPTVSRFHADVRSEAGGHVLYSSGATGTEVNEAPIGAPRLLQEGDTIGLGRMTLVYTTTAPPGIKVVPPAGTEESAATRRSTVVDMQAYRETTLSRSAGRGVGMMPLLIGAIVVLVGVIAWMALR